MKIMTNHKEEQVIIIIFYGIIDTKYEERFDRLTRIATKLFDVPIALVSLIDRDEAMV